MITATFGWTSSGDTGLGAHLGQGLDKALPVRILELDLFVKLRRHAGELLRRERGDDFFEAWIATERVPEGVQF